MKSDKLVTDEVVARCKALRDSRGVRAATIQLRNRPATRALRVEEDGLAIAAEAGLRNLEPACSVTRAAAESAGALVHPDQDRSLAVCPLLPDSGNFVSRSSCGAQGRAATSIASKLGRCAG